MFAHILSLKCSPHVIYFPLRESEDVEGVIPFYLLVLLQVCWQGVWVGTTELRKWDPISEALSWSKPVFVLIRTARLSLEAASGRCPSLEMRTLMAQEGHSTSKIKFWMPRTNGSHSIPSSLWLLTTFKLHLISVPLAVETSTISVWNSPMLIDQTPHLSLRLLVEGTNWSTAKPCHVIQVNERWVLFCATQTRFWCSHQINSDTYTLYSTHFLS